MQKDIDLSIKFPALVFGNIYAYISSMQMFLLGALVLISKQQLLHAKRRMGCINKKDDF